MQKNNIVLMQTSVVCGGMKWEVYFLFSYIKFKYMSQSYFIG